MSYHKEKSVKTAVILAGGKGERLRPLTESLPKPMIEIHGKPLLQHQIELLRQYDVSSIYILTGYLGDIISDYFGEGDIFDVNISYVHERFPLGTAGAVKQLESIKGFPLDQDFFLVYGDVFFDVKLDDFISYHRQKNGAATLTVHPSDHPHDSDLVALDENFAITRIIRKPHNDKYAPNMANAGVYILSSTVFDYISPEKMSDFMKDIFPQMITSGETVYAYKTAEYLKDMGTLQRLKKVKSDVMSGRTRRLSKQNSRPAIFLDRDGTLVKYVDLLSSTEELELYDFTPSAIRSINRSEYLALVVTNQSVVARNLCDISGLQGIHNKMETLLGKSGVYLDDIFFCPHHPDKGYAGENPLYKKYCQCRKPGTGMIDAAKNIYNIDLDLSWLVGDTTVDIQTGLNAGLHTILLRSGKGGKDGKYVVAPDFICGTVKDAIDFIINEKKLLDEAVASLFSSFSLQGPLTLIAVGGASRSGKTTFVKCLQQKLCRMKVKSKVLSLDNWLLGQEEREKGMTVLQRYKCPLIESDVKKMLNGEGIWIKRYDPYSRAVIGKDYFEVSDEKCLIVEGVPALNIKGIREISHLRLFCEIEEAERKKRFTSFYRWKDMPQERIDKLYFERMIDEVPHVRQSRIHADYIITKNGIEECALS